MGLDVEAIANKPRETVCLHCLRRRVEWMNALTAYQSRECSMISEACRDYLTGLLNRRGFQTALDSIQKEDFPVAVFLFDLDNLKLTNDQMGHGAGDQLLKHFADVLRQNTRSSDILCRYGGDEFLIVIIGNYNRKKIDSDAQNILNTLNQEYNKTFEFKELSASIGISQDTLKENNTALILTNNSLTEAVNVLQNDLLKKSDNSLYQAKKKGRNCYIYN